MEGRGRDDRSVPRARDRSGAARRVSTSRRPRSGAPSCKDKPGALEAYEHALDELLREQPLRPATPHARARHVPHRRRARHRRQELEVPRAGVSPDDQAGAEGRSGRWCRCGTRSARSIARGSSTTRARSRRSRSRTRSIPTSRRERARHPRRALRARPARSSPSRSRERAAKLVEVDPTNPDAYRALGRTSLEAGRIDEAWCVRARARVPQAGERRGERAVPALPGARGRARRPASSTTTRGRSSATPTRIARSARSSR